MFWTPEWTPESWNVRDSRIFLSYRHWRKHVLQIQCSVLPAVTSSSASEREEDVHVRNHYHNLLYSTAIISFKKESLHVANYSITFHCVLHIPNTLFWRQLKADLDGPGVCFCIIYRLNVENAVNSCYKRKANCTILQAHKYVLLSY